MSHTKAQPNLSKIARRMYGKFVPRVRGDHEALPVQICNSTVRETYCTGAGETSQPVRAGSMVAYSIPSRGYRT